MDLILVVVIFLALRHEKLTLNACKKRPGVVDIVLAAELIQLQPDLPRNPGEELTLILPTSYRSIAAIRCLRRGYGLFLPLSFSSEYVQNFRHGLPIAYREMPDKRMGRKLTHERRMSVESISLL